MKLFSRAVCYFILGGCFLLSACAADSKAPSDSISESTQTEDESAVSAVENKPVFSAGDGVYVPTDSGIYEVQPVFSGSVNIFYTDVNSGERIYLCNNPSCTHNNDTCTSYISTESSFPPMLLQGDDELLVFFTEATSSSNPYLMAMNYDGTNRHTLFELNSNQYLQGNFYISGESLYFDVMNINGDGSTQYQLWSANLDNGNAESILDLGNDEQYYTLAGCSDSDLCFQHLTDQGIEYCKYSFASNSIEDPFYVDNSTSGNSLIADGYLFVLDEEAHTLSRIDISTNQSKVSNYTVVDGYGFPTMRYLFDGKVLLTENELESADTSYDVRSFVIDFDANSCNEMTLRTPYNNRPVYVLASIGDLCYVATDYKTYTPTSISDDGTASTFDYVSNSYALITKTDYLNSNENGYQMIKDSFE